MAFFQFARVAQHGAALAPDHHFVHEQELVTRLRIEGGELLQKFSLVRDEIPADKMRRSRILNSCFYLIPGRRVEYIVHAGQKRVVAEPLGKRRDYVRGFLAVILAFLEELGKRLKGRIAEIIAQYLCDVVRARGNFLLHVVLIFRRKLCILD